jgi:hypothetical protein
MRIKPIARVIAKFPAEKKKEKGNHFSINFFEVLFSIHSRSRLM